MSLELNSGQSSVGTLVLTDTITGLPITGATFAGVTATGNDTTIASVVVNPDNTLTASGLASGTTTVLVNANVTFIDSNGNTQSSVPLSFTETIKVDQPAPPPPHPVTLSVSWSTPA